MDTGNKQVVIVTDDPGWHGRELTKALSDRGLTSRYVSLTESMMVIAHQDKPLSLAGFDEQPLGVFVRGVPGGSLEQVIFRMNILHALHEQGVTVFNSPRSIERTVDKPLTSLLLSQAGIPTPPTWICESEEYAKHILQQQFNKGHRMVLKPLFGSQGVGVHLLNKMDDLVQDEKFAGIYYLQQFVERKQGEFTDIRVMVVAGKAVAAMLRRGETWLTNRAQGAKCEPMIMDKQLTDMAESACRVIDIDYAGVDIMLDKDGNYFLIEVNSIPAWYGLQQVVNFNVAACLIDAFINRISKTSNLKVCAN